MDHIAVLIPCYNEEKTISKVVRDFRASLGDDAVIYVYDNNSTDKTSEHARAAGAVVRTEKKQGKGNVLRRMFREIDARCYIMVDGDDTYPAENAPEMVRLVLEEGADMVVGDRLSSTYFEENKRPFHNFGNSFVRGAINRLFGTEYRDIMTGYRAMSYEFVKTFPVLSRGFEIETEMSIHAADKNMNVRNIVVDYKDRPEGSVSKLNTFADGFKVISTIIRLLRTYRPLQFFGTISGVASFLGAIFVLPVFKAYRETKKVERFPTLIVCCFAFLTAILSLFTGFELETMSIKNRQDFEAELKEADEEKKKLEKIKKGVDK
ncbi:MAG: glycosyltransferase family 2 protein [Lachnospiraceae bacterium]|nr:glycosyltransferase family 2 protein [Lachnospiraceae bacterium]